MGEDLYLSFFMPKIGTNTLSSCFIIMVWGKKYTILHRGSEIVENYEKAERDYMGGMKYKDIAEKYVNHYQHC